MKTWECWNIAPMYDSACPACWNIAPMYGLANRGHPNLRTPHQKQVAWRFDFISKPRSKSMLPGTSISFLGSRLKSMRPCA